MKQLILRILVTVLSILSFSIVTKGQDYTVTGTQIRERGTYNIQLKCKGYELDSTRTIANVSGNNAGFWISGKNGKIKDFDSQKDAVGFTLDPGIYWFYPHLRENKSNATVTIRLIKE